VIKMRDFLTHDEIFSKDGHVRRLSNGVLIIRDCGVPYYVVSASPVAIFREQTSSCSIFCCCSHVQALLSLLVTGISGCSTLFQSSSGGLKYVSNAHGKGSN